MSWLPEDVHVNLTAFEAGALMEILRHDKKTRTNMLDERDRFMVNKPGPDGEPVPIQMIDRLIEKLSDAVKELK